MFTENHRPPLCLPREVCPQRGHPRIAGLRLPCAIGYSRRGNKLALGLRHVSPITRPIRSARQALRWVEKKQKRKTPDKERHGRGHRDLRMANPDPLKTRRAFYKGEEYFASPCEKGGLRGILLTPLFCGAVLNACPTG
jgi:hypothetical protein